MLSMILALCAVKIPSFPSQAPALQVSQLESVGLQLALNNTLSVGLLTQRVSVVCDDLHLTNQDHAARPTALYHISFFPPLPLDHNHTVPL